MPATPIKNTFKERHAIWEALGPVVVKHKDGTVNYLPPASDRTVADAMGFPCSPAAVAGVRKEMFGFIQVRNPLPAVAANEDLERRVARIEAFIREAWGTDLFPAAEKEVP